MKTACFHQSDALMLDVLREPMDPMLRRQWEEHLASCEGCRRERAELEHVLGRVRNAGEPPALSAQQADAMVNAVAWRLRNERLETHAAPRRRITVWRSLAAACALLVVVALGYRAQEHFFPEPVADLQDIEVIKHLDLLREMDTIEKLVEVVDLDLAPAGQPEQAPATETQGNRDGNGNEKAYV
jgi:hypothetical protein